MKSDKINISGIEIEVKILDTVIVGSGCAGLNAADWLYNLAHKDIAIITEGINKGTSRNTGSDKQTYYKMSVCGNIPDSISALTQTLFSGGGVNGDTALTEAACSLQCFYKLVNLGVPFPHTCFGEYPGYKTDHDPIQRATSAGPLTSKYMTEALQHEVESKKIPIFDNTQAIKIITRVKNGETLVAGILAIETHNITSQNYGLVLFCCNNIIWATGGPAGIYLRSVYPESQTGSTGVAIEAGAEASNLQEWQYGLASTKFRWNVSGTYQQVLPRYISIDKNGTESEFLYDYFTNENDAHSMAFLKGYQWPFDVRKLEGSSLIDLIIYNETVEKGNRVYMDYTRNPSKLSPDFSNVSEEAYNYLEKSQALLKTPIERLGKMNPDAIDLYKKHGINLEFEPLEVTVCAQHQNGGLYVDRYWQSNIKGLFPVGEAAGTFGVYRPGGSALNSTQVGSMRAAQYISQKTFATIDNIYDFKEVAFKNINSTVESIINICNNLKTENNIFGKRKELQTYMSNNAGHIRNAKLIKGTIQKLEEMLESFWMDTQISSPSQLPDLLKNKDLIISALACLSAMYHSTITAKSRGSALVTEENGFHVSPFLSFYKYDKKYDLDYYKDYYLQTKMNSKYSFQNNWIRVRPIPDEVAWFENVWSDYRNKTIFK